MKITTNTGETFTTDTAQGIVRAMRDTQWGLPVVKRDYMAETSARVESMTGAVIHHDKGAETFLNDLNAAGFITIHDDEPTHDTILDDDIDERV